MTRPGAPHPHPFRIFLSRIVLTPVLLSMPATSSAETVEGLVARLDEAVRQVEAARDNGTSLRDPGALFPETEEVAWGGGTILVDHTSLRAVWRAVPGEGSWRQSALEGLRDRLVAVRAEVESGRLAVGGGAAPVGWREKVSEILSRPEFSKRPAGEPLLARIIRWLRDKLGLQTRQARWNLEFIWDWILRIVAGASVLMALVILARAALPLFVRDRRTAFPAGPAAPGEPETLESLLALEQARTRAGDLRGAVQAVFRWMLLTLSQTGRLQYDPALTNREHLARLKADATVRGTFEELCCQFELVWYGYRPLSQEDYVAFRTGCQRLAGDRA